ncbi:MAG: hypothetical protein E7255_10530 [Lachnospiraceae bacterium]|nr:hypothetical protein [Lachnospiraceae bacterium]
MDKSAYIHILGDSLEKKVSVLDQLLEATLLQEKYLAENPSDMNDFEHAYTVKEALLEKLDKLDEGFELIYRHVREELSSQQVHQKEEILSLQELIRQVTEKSTQIQAIEMRNRNKLDSYFSKQKESIKSYKVNSKTASSYYKNMADQHSGESYFYDKKK